MTHHPMLVRGNIYYKLLCTVVHVLQVQNINPTLRCYPDDVTKYQVLHKKQIMFMGQIPEKCPIRINLNNRNKITHF